MQGQSSNNNKSERIKDDEYIYDLYGVCNHDGSMSQGHYRGKTLRNCLRIFYTKDPCTELCLIALHIMHYCNFYGNGYFLLK